MEIDPREVIAVMEVQRKLAIDELRGIVIDAQRHINMLEMDIPDRPLDTGHSIAQQESTHVGSAVEHATRHDMLLRVLRHGEA